MKSSSQSRLISIVGVHGVGKSTILSGLQKIIEFKLPPPTKTNEFKYSAILSFIHFLIERYNQHIRLRRSPGLIITDRYAFLDTSIYVQCLTKLELITKEEKELFIRILNSLPNVWLVPYLIFVLVCDPKIIEKRILQRSKSSVNHFRPLDPNILREVNLAFHKFASDRQVPDFINNKLKKNIEKCEIILLDTAKESVKETILRISGSISYGKK